MKSAPYPSTNELVERAVQTFKNSMKKQTGTLQTRLSHFLFKYRTTPHTTTGISPAELRWGTNLRSHLTLLQPDVKKTVRYAQEVQKKNSDQHVRQRSISVGDDVYVRNYSTPKLPWSVGKVVKCTGPISAEVQLNGEKVVRRHQDHISSSSSENPKVKVPENTEEINPSGKEIQFPHLQVPESRCYPTRERKKPKKLDDYAY